MKYDPEILELSEEDAKSFTQGRPPLISHGAVRPGIAFRHFQLSEKEENHDHTRLCPLALVYLVRNRLFCDNYFLDVGRTQMIRRYSYRQLMRLLTSKKCFVMKEGERYFFAQIVD